MVLGRRRRIIDTNAAVLTAGTTKRGGRLLTVAEAAAALNVSAATVRGLIAARRLRHERHGVRGGTIRIPEDALEEYRAGVTVRAGGEVRVPTPAPRPVKLLRNLSLN